MRTALRPELRPQTYRQQPLTNKVVTNTIRTLTQHLLVYRVRVTIFSKEAVAGSRRFTVMTSAKRLHNLRLQMRHGMNPSSASVESRHTVPEFVKDTQHGPQSDVLAADYTDQACRTEYIEHAAPSV